MTEAPRMGGLVAVGFLSLAVGAERFVNAILVEPNGSYVSTRMLIAVVCIAAASVCFALAARERGKPPRDRRP